MIELVRVLHRAGWEEKVKKRDAREEMRMERTSGAWAHDGPHPTGGNPGHPTQIVSLFTDHYLLEQTQRPKRRTKVEDDEQNTLPATNARTDERSVCWPLFISTHSTQIHGGTHARTQHNPGRTLTSTGRIPRSRRRLHLLRPLPLGSAHTVTVVRQQTCAHGNTLALSSGCPHGRTSTQYQYMAYIAGLTLGLTYARTHD